MLAQNLDSASSSTVASSSSQPKTPIIAGSVCGGVLGLAWIIGFAIYFRKRYKRKLRNQGKLPPLEMKKSKEEPQEKIVIPPDPAILINHHPGEHYSRMDKTDAKSSPPDEQFLPANNDIGTTNRNEVSLGHVISP
ncbi:hypothetical protein J3R30DRAFT_1740954 [Lentinula aciculospora]|uniref:Uncharacterized protein n=1 Tax=Lentinula aciculospora TaxID=153920 RepID=A0A9W9AIB2_9AGAR|nr:hypothetical protein J3R30DRAFT_1740954 [Lentinula aciculospora]